MVINSRVTKNKVNMMDMVNIMKQMEMYIKVNG